MSSNLVSAGCHTAPLRKEMSGPLAAAFVLLLFPGYFLYHYAVASGMIAPVVGGWFGPISLVAVVVLVPFGARACLHARGRVAHFVTMFGLLVVYVGLWTGGYYLLHADSQQSAVALEGGGGLVVFWVVLFFIGYFLDFNRGWFWRGLLLSFGAMAALTLLNIDPSRVMFYVRQPQVTEHVASYQGFARSVVATAILLLAFSRRLAGQIAVLAVGAAVLFFVGARSEFFGFLLVGGVWAGWSFVQRSLPKKIVVGLAVLLLGMAVFSSVGLRGSRQLQVLDLSSASSWQARQELLEEGVAEIVASPLVGEFAGQMTTRGFGAYIHNGLSAWRQFGLVGFLLYAGMALASMWFAVEAVWLKRRQTPRWMAALYLNVMCVVLIVVAKSVFWELPALAWGLTAGALFRDRWVSQVRVGE